MMATIIGVEPIVVEFSAQTSVTVTHNLSYKPAVEVLDSAGVVVDAHIKHTDSNIFVASFGVSLTGSILYR